jgi:hypothetical protein
MKWKEKVFLENIDLVLFLSFLASIATAILMKSDFKFGLYGGGFIYLIVVLLSRYC